MKTPYRNIFSVLKLNRFIVLAVVIGAVITCVVSVVLVILLHKETVNNAFVVNTEGQIIPLKFVSLQENLEVEALAHLENFHRYFYNIDASNYEKNLEKALWLGNSTVDGLYRQKKADGVYNRLLQYSLLQKVISIHSKVDIQAEPYAFETKTVFEINRGSIIDTYEMTTIGKLIQVDRHFPNNPHGLLITNYFENTLKRIDNEN
ncbi:conjugal transfer protein TraK [Pseudotamlana carrageenivorans]|uniref:Conjugal transfer protein TraK n=1 Tax=Pseudotamlana carrageenivorans TaxID=2069432 RepID=A0A2I7SK34_9FLAO|nr:conjugal transfer protein TraK [Tamlana carrageenivorans]AUS06266.1 conjugal transfer protein TraK [Tamlana carrageenivorans]